MKRLLHTLGNHESWANGQIAVGLLRYELLDLADALVPLTNGGVLLHKLQGVMHDTWSWSCYWSLVFGLVIDSLILVLVFDGFLVSCSESYSYIYCGEVYTWAVWANRDYALLRQV